MRIVHSLALAAFAALVPGARAQSIYFEDFSSGAPGWTLGSSGGGVQWKADALPASTPNGAAFSAPASLNFNNDVDYEGAYGGTAAVSPPIDLSVATGVPVLVFWCNNQTVEYTCDPHEWITFSVAGQPEQFMGIQNGCTFNCTSSAWHPHTVPLDASWGSVQLRFDLRTDGLFDNGPGWFVDDIGIYDAPAPVTYCTPKVMQSGCLPKTAWYGAFASVSDPSACRLACTGVAPQKNGMFFYGTTGRTAAPFLGGTLCVNPPVRRTFVLPSAGFAGAYCQGTFDLDFNAWIQSSVDPALVAGTQVDGQFWYREPNTTFDTGLSNGIEFVIQP